LGFGGHCADTLGGKFHQVEMKFYWKSVMPPVGRNWMGNSPHCRRRLKGQSG
jgi:hypothetical protein